ncbi:Protein saf4 [Recurvomyces mirabilis]|uniref:Protein saf4 n=1 Tax=Recurvomyces mirabilis TaxID=574656 RepID=A0AAE0WVD1_9PEZI|nr:Protein saf4 [Recurvomyces mirabilis]KAK5156641.1 Protein saf4 [Recurvomyces mirabilis]
MQGFNMGRYIPPDQAGGPSGNKLNSRRAPGTLRKDGSQTVRFELPYAVWCTTCKPHAIIGQGVRFNAIKKKVGSYYSTPIWSFTLKHVTCGGAIEVRTDPKNTAYVVVSGGKARDYGEDKVREGEGKEGGVPILTEAERERRREDAFANLEGKVEEKRVEKDNGKRIRELYRNRERDWDDPWSANKRMRTGFRRERKVLEREEKEGEALKKRLGTDIELLPESEEDGRRAGMVTFGVGEDGRGDDGSGAAGKALFRHELPVPSSRSLVKAKSRAKRKYQKDLLRRQLVNNTRAAIDPFGSGGS